MKPSQASISSSRELAVLKDERLDSELETPPLLELTDSLSEDSRLLAISSQSESEKVSGSESEEEIRPWVSETESGWFMVVVGYRQKGTRPVLCQSLSAQAAPEPPESDEPPILSDRQTLGILPFDFDELFAFDPTR